MDGLSLQTNSDNTVVFCVVEKLTDEIKKIMRDDLSRICFGERKSLSGKSIYSYERTIKEFIKRYKTKSEDIKTGMLGELLCHIMLPRFCSHLRPASAYFNAEESSVKKGFDIILYSKIDDSIWFTEVKAGEIGKKTPLNKMRALIDLAKSDLHSRINENDSTTWYSAINNVETALSSGVKAKDKLVSLLSDLIEGEEDGEVSASNHSAVLAPVLFENVSNLVNFSEIQEKAEKVVEAGLFSQCVILAIQKSTVTKLEKFLLEEAGE